MLITKILGLFYLICPSWLISIRLKVLKVGKIPLLFCYSRKDGSISVEISQAHDTLIEEHYTVSLMGPQMTGQMWVHYHVCDIQPLSIVLQL